MAGDVGQTGSKKERERGREKKKRGEGKRDRLLCTAPKGFAVTSVALYRGDKSFFGMCTEAAGRKNYMRMVMAVRRR